MGGNRIFFAAALVVGAAAIGAAGYLWLAFIPALSAAVLSLTLERR